MKEIKIEKCQYCSGRDFIECEVSASDEFGLSQIYLARQERSNHLFATVCRDCGSVVRTFCKKPENLR